MTIKAIKEAYANYKADCGKTMYKVYDFGGEYGKCVIICKNAGHDLKTVDQVVRVADGKELLADHRWRWCDNLEDAIEVAGEMLADNDEYIEEPDLNEEWNNDLIIVKANGNEANEYTFRLIDGDFFEGETVTVETVLDGKRYTRKVKSDSWDLYVTIKGGKAYWESDRVAEPMPEPKSEREETFADYEEAPAREVTI